MLCILRVLVKFKFMPFRKQTSISLHYGACKKMFHFKQSKLDDNMVTIILGHTCNRWLLSSLSQTAFNKRPQTFQPKLFLPENDHMSMTFCDTAYVFFTMTIDGGYLWYNSTNLGRNSTTEVEIILPSTQEC